jgi:hypothetical protein
MDNLACRWAIGWAGRSALHHVGSASSRVTLSLAFLGSLSTVIRSFRAPVRPQREEQRSRSPRERDEQAPSCKSHAGILPTTVIG